MFFATYNSAEEAQKAPNPSHRFLYVLCYGATQLLDGSTDLTALTDYDMLMRCLEFENSLV